jgi:hypothetical protein
MSDTFLQSKMGAGYIIARVNAMSFLRAMLSVIQASFGVQSPENRERDFTRGKLWLFIVAALLFTAVFVLTIVTVVSMVLK